MPGNPEQYLLKHLNHFHMKKIPIIINMCCTKTKPFFCWLGHRKMSFYYPSSH